MDSPKKIEAGGWYMYGTHPGDPGSAVITGHLIGKKRQPGVFIDLHKLRVGDTILVEDDAHAVVAFTVARIQDL